MAQSRATNMIWFVDGSSEHLEQELYDGDVSCSRSMVESRAPCFIRLVDGGSEFFDQALHDV
jgi:hypothetical protein